MVSVPFAKRLLGSRSKGCASPRSPDDLASGVVGDGTVHRGRITVMYRGARAEKAKFSSDVIFTLVIRQSASDSDLA